MKKLTIVVAFFAFCIGSLMAQEKFEGELTMQSGEGDEQMHFVVKGDKVKVINLEEEDSESPQVFLDGATGDMFILAHKNGKELAVKMNMREDSPMGAMMKLKMDQSSDMEEKVDKTMESLKKIGAEKRHGYNCDIYKGSNEEGEFKVWVTQELNLTLADLFPVSQQAGSMMREKFLGIGMDGIPLKIEYTGEDEHSNSFEIVPEARTVKASEVTVSSNTEIIEMGNIMAELMQANGDPEKMKALEEKMKIFQDMMGN